MESATLTSTGLYLYVFVRSEDVPIILDASLSGLNDAKLLAITGRSVAAIVSPIVERKIRPQRKLLAAHQEVVTKAAEKVSSLPVSFGLIADSENQILKLLERHEEVLVEQLEQVGDQVEMTISVKWAVPNIFAYFIERTPELKLARDRIGAGIASRDEQIELGRAFEYLIGAERNRHTEAILHELRTVCSDVEVQPVTAENDVVKLACLIHGGADQAFAAALNAAAAKFNEEFLFNYSGPWPPYSFVKLTLSFEG